MNFNVVSTLLAVSSAHDTIHIFKLGTNKAPSPASSPTPTSASKNGNRPSSPSGSVDSRDGGQDLEGGYDAFVDEQKKNRSMSSVLLIHFLCHLSHVHSFVVRSSLRRKSLQMTKSLTHSVGGYLPNTLTEMWEPSRDFAFLRLPTSGSRCIVALSG